MYYKWNVSDGEGTYIDRFQEDRAVNPRWGLSKRGLVGGGFTHCCLLSVSRSRFACAAPQRVNLGLTESSWKSNRDSALKVSALDAGFPC